MLNSSPDLPLTFLFFQLLIAVLLLHLSAALSRKIQIPKLDLQVAKSLFPVVSVNIIGLVFNTLCLRDVDASFFQVMVKFITCTILYVQLVLDRLLVASCYLSP